MRNGLPAVARFSIWMPAWRPCLRGAFAELWNRNLAWRSGGAALRWESAGHAQDELGHEEAGEHGECIDLSNGTHFHSL